MALSSKEVLQQKRHSLAHALGAALCARYPGTKLAIGPPTEDGFFYDAEVPVTLSVDDLPALEKEMRTLLSTWDTFQREVVSAEEARKRFKDNPYKLEIIDQLVEEGVEITVYTSGSFSDLCEGGHVATTAGIAPDSFSLVAVAGAYWRGDEANRMLTRVSGIAFATKEELEEHRALLEEAKKRDHRVLGKELQLFTSSPLIGAGLPLFTPKGTALRRAIEKALGVLLEKYGYEIVWIPHLTRPDLYKTSGHWEKFGDELFKVRGKHDEFVLKPMNCPHHTQIYASTLRSYTELPVRYAEFTTVYRDEQKGELLGLSRVLSITQDDGHIFCTQEQIAEEVSATVSLIREFYTALGFFKGDDCEISLSVRSDEKENYLGSDALWERAEHSLAEVLEQSGLHYTTEKGEAAFYGPKIDFIFRDSLKRKRQLATIQLDFVMPERFSLRYVDAENNKQTPVMIHRAIAGSLERFIGVLLEHFAGAFPFFIAPVQVRVLSVSEQEEDYARSVTASLRKVGIRAECDSAADSVGKKLARVHAEKLPSFIVVGSKEVQERTVSLTLRGGEKQVRSLEEALALLKKENDVF